nr:MAG TPA: Gifsy-2 prophage ATP-binding sugar transporter-like barrel, 4 helix bundle.7A [Caudoviricetes sp.]
MNLKAIIEQDLQNVFFNTNEFAEVHFLDDKEIPIIIDEDEIQKRRIQAAEGTYVGEKLVLVEAKYFKRKPVEGRSLKLDHKEYFIASCKEVDGIFEITLGVNDSD